MPLNVVYSRSRLCSQEPSKQYSTFGSDWTECNLLWLTKIDTRVKSQWQLPFGQEKKVKQILACQTERAASSYRSGEGIMSKKPISSHIQVAVTGKLAPGTMCKKDLLQHPSPPFTPSTPHRPFSSFPSRTETMVLADIVCGSRPSERVTDVDAMSEGPPSPDSYNA